MKSYSNKIEGTAALQIDANTNNQMHIIDFEYAQKSRYVSSSSCKTYTSSHRTIAQRINDSTIASPFFKQGEQRSSLVVANTKSIALYTTIITALFVFCTLLFV